MAIAGRASPAVPRPKFEHISAEPALLSSFSKLHAGRRSPAPSSPTLALAFVVKSKGEQLCQHFRANLEQATIRRRPDLTLPPHLRLHRTSATTPHPHHGGVFPDGAAGGGCNQSHAESSGLKGEQKSDIRVDLPSLTAHLSTR